MEEAIEIIEKYIRKIRGQDFTSRIQRSILKLVLSEIKQAAQQSVHPTLLTPCEYCGGSHDKSLGCHESLLVTQSG